MCLGAGVLMSARYGAEVAVFVMLLFEVPLLVKSLKEIKEV